MVVDEGVRLFFGLGFMLMLELRLELASLDGGLIVFSSEKIVKGRDCEEEGIWGGTVVFARSTGTEDVGAGARTGGGAGSDEVNVFVVADIDEEDEEEDDEEDDEALCLASGSIIIRSAETTSPPPPPSTPSSCRLTLSFG